MQRATISVSEGRFPEAHFDNRRIMEPSIGYALTRLSAQARTRGTGITVEVDDRGTRLTLTIDAEGRLHTPPDTQAATGGRAEAQSDASAPTQALPLAPEPPPSQGPAPSRPSRPHEFQPHRRTFGPDGQPAPAVALAHLPVQSHTAPASRLGRASSAAAHPGSAPAAPGLPTRAPTASRAPAQRARIGVPVALLVAAVLALCCAGVLFL